MQLYTWFLVSLLAIVTIIGIPGNILVLLVYANKTKRTGTRVFILGLAAVDLFICALSGYRFYLWIHEDSFSSDFICRFFSWIGLASELSSAFVTTAVAVDRYLAICRPHLGWMTHKRAQIVCFTGVVASTVLTLPAVLVYTASTDTQGHKSCEITGSDVDRYWVYIALFVMATAFIIMMITSLAMYMLIYREVRKRLKVRPSIIQVAPAEKSSDKEAGRSNHLTGMLMVGDSMIGISLHSRSSDNRRHSIGEAEGISQKLIKPRNRTRAGSPVSFRRSFKEKTDSNPKSVKTGHGCLKDCQEKRKVAIATVGSSSEDTGSDHGPKTKLTADHNESTDHAIKKGKKSKTGKMLLLATVVFVVTWSARLLMWLISYMLDEKWTYLKDTNDVAFAFLSLLQHLYYTTPAVNPAIYSFVNDRFREECLKIVRKMNCLKGSNMR
ncbi:octopamine receptor-like [Patiria miniata]|uniref:G-protein coupled receptors family 1 profile domain-containing protein n=1 Tax=Patiria miniata TaxID=46514 RepID=A0A914BJK5_PATMI|nr:octopamine receptor-like [Patiria miniata]